MKPTLAQAFSFSLLGLSAMLGLLFFIVFRATQATIIESSERLRASASGEIADQVQAFLGAAPAAATHIQALLQRALLDPHAPAALEAGLLSELLGRADLGEMTFTYAGGAGFDAEGALVLSTAPRGQVSVWRTFDSDGQEKFCSRQLHQEGGKFFAERRDLPTDNPGGRAGRPEEAPDPTMHATFTTPASRTFTGKLLWSDLHRSQLDVSLPEAQRRVEVSAQRTIMDAQGQFAGVLRVGLLAEQLGKAVQLKMHSRAAETAHRVFLCDTEGRLIARGRPGDRWVEAGDDLRLAAPDLAPEVALALANPARGAAPPDGRAISGGFQLGGKDYLTTFRALPGSQDWLVGIVVPRAFYLGRLERMRQQLLLGALAVMLLVVVGGGLLLRRAGRAQRQVVRECLKMNGFEFAPASTDAGFRDITAVLESLEKAKTAMRAMSKYVPIDLVRRLYREQNEPVLGGEPQEISLMFTDIKGFTTYAEELPAGELAAALGRYLEVMSRIIHETRGTIDKYIGDAIMTLWNAPEPLAGHAVMACRAAWRCRTAGEALALTPEWAGRPAFATRFGLHRGEALVGHFGAPDRLNYTAIGDAVNFASRLEGLNKLYGTFILASEAVVEEAREHFAFRLLDRVAVQGKSRVAAVYELLGPRIAGDELPEFARVYQEAFAAYLVRRFAEAIALLEVQTGDPPSLVLLERCRHFMHEPPSLDWNGDYAATSK